MGYRSGRFHVEFLPTKHHGCLIHFLDALEDARLQFVDRLDANVAQERTRHFGENVLDKIESGTMLGRVNILEAVRAGGKVCTANVFDVSMFTENDGVGE